MSAYLVVVDMQNDFVRKDGALSVDADNIIPHIKKLCCEHGANIMYTLDLHFNQDWDEKLVPETKVFPPHCIDGTDGELIVDDLSIYPSRRISYKFAYAPDEHDIGKVFSNGECEKITFVGVTTDVCVFQTAIAFYTYAINERYYPEFVVDLYGCKHINKERARNCMEYLRDVLGMTILGMETLDFDVSELAKEEK